MAADKKVLDMAKLKRFGGQSAIANSVEHRPLPGLTGPEPFTPGNDRRSRRGKIQKLNLGRQPAMLWVRWFMSSKSPSPPINYSDRFQEPTAVAAYETKEYGVGSYSSFIWELQRPVLEKIVADFRKTQADPVRLLDFACGTGRVISCLEPLVDTAEGVDISESMVAVARKKCRTARFQVGDILSRPEMLHNNYDVITSFRFLLNVEPELRSRVLKKLREVLREPDGLLVVNVHGNSRSLRHPAIVWRRWRERANKTDAMLNEMSPVETKQLLQSSGFHIVHQFGFGMLPPTLYRTPLRGAAAVVDKVFAGENRWSDRSIDLLFVCRPV